MAKDSGLMPLIVELDLRTVVSLVKDLERYMKEISWLLVEIQNFKFYNCERSLQNQLCIEK